MLEDRTNIQLNDPLVLLRSRAALTLGRAAYGLTANAFEHDALSVPEGNVEVTSGAENVVKDERLVAKWIERQGACGFARSSCFEMIERGSFYDTSGEAVVDFTPGERRR